MFEHIVRPCPYHNIPSIEQSILVISQSYMSDRYANSLIFEPSVDLIQ
jgi:hypothetical protein